jgi:hypothetical protein
MKFADDRGVIAFDITALSRADQAPASIDVSHLRSLNHPTWGVAPVLVRTSVSGDSRFSGPTSRSGSESVPTTAAHSPRQPAAAPARPGPATMTPWPSAARWPGQDRTQSNTGVGHSGMCGCGSGPGGAVVGRDKFGVLPACYSSRPSRVINSRPQADHAGSVRRPAHTLAVLPSWSCVTLHNSVPSGTNPGDEFRGLGQRPATVRAPARPWRSRVRD